MSKCKPKANAEAMNLGFQIEDVVTTGENPNRFIVVKIPYDKLLSDPEISQRKISDIVKILVIDEGEAAESATA